MVKNMLLEAVLQEISPQREKYYYYMSHFDEVQDMLSDGAKKARPLAQKTLDMLKSKIFGGL